MECSAKLVASFASGLSEPRHDNQRPGPLLQDPSAYAEESREFLPFLTATDAHTHTHTQSCAAFISFSSPVSLHPARPLLQGSVFKKRESVLQQHPLRSAGMLKSQDGMFQSCPLFLHVFIVLFFSHFMKTTYRLAF